MKSSNQSSETHASVDSKEMIALKSQEALPCLFHKKEAGRISPSGCWNVDSSLPHRVIP